MEPVQNAGGCFTPPDGYFQRDPRDLRRVRRADDLRRGDLLVGPPRQWFGAQRYDYQPDVITTAKGITGAIAPLGAMIVSDRVAEPFMEGDETFLHGFTFAGHPISRGGRARRRSTPTSARASSSTCARTRAPFRAHARVAARHPDRRRRARRRLLPRDRARQGPRDEGDVRRRRVRDAAARLPLRRAVPPRADLPRRRPRRPGHPALAAADRRAPSSSREIEAVLRPVLEEATRRMHVRRASACPCGHEGEAAC